MLCLYLKQIARWFANGDRSPLSADARKKTLQRPFRPLQRSFHLTCCRKKSKARDCGRNPRPGDLQISSDHDQAVIALVVRYAIDVKV